jgi:hypothetical protein
MKKTEIIDSAIKKTMGLGDDEPLNLIEALEWVESIIPKGNNVIRFMTVLKGKTCVVLDMYDGQKNLLGLGYVPNASKEDAIRTALISFIGWLEESGLEYYLKDKV